MYKLFLLLIVCSLFSSCSSSAPQRASNSTFTAGNEAELRDGANRVNSFKQELINRGFKTFSSTGSNLWDEVGLRGDYGELKDVEITLRVAKELNIKESHLGAGLRAGVGSKAAEQEFEKLESHIRSVIQGK